MTNKNEVDTRSKERIEEAKEVLRSFVPVARMYWLDKIVKQGSLSASEAGVIIAYGIGEGAKV
jgi:hypothetical protein